MLSVMLFYFDRLGLILILKGLIINYPYQVSTSTTVIEEREVVYTSSQPDNSVQWDPLAGEALEMREEMVDEAGEPVKPVTVRFVLEESSGYMEPMLRILAVLHTVISFFCIIGYYCLKVGNYYCIIAEKKKDTGICINFFIITYNSQIAHLLDFSVHHLIFLYRICYLKYF